MVLFQMST